MKDVRKGLGVVLLLATFLVLELSLVPISNIIWSMASSSSERK